MVDRIVLSKSNAHGAWDGELTMEELLPFNEPEYIANPYAYWQRLRDDAPVYWSRTHGFWVISRYDDVLQVLHDPARAAISFSYRVCQSS